MTSLFKAFRKFSNPGRRPGLEPLFELLDALDGPFHIIEQSIIGDAKATYKKINPFIKWMVYNIAVSQEQTKPDEDYQWSTYG